jgi:hypothetical protein
MTSHGGSQAFRSHNVSKSATGLGTTTTLGPCAHKHVDVEPVSGYLGDAIVGVWQEMEPLIHAERAFRGPTTDPAVAGVLREPDPTCRAVPARPGAPTATELDTLGGHRLHALRAVLRGIRPRDDPSTAS